MWVHNRAVLPSQCVRCFDFTAFQNSPSKRLTQWSTVLFKNNNNLTSLKKARELLKSDCKQRPLLESIYSSTGPFYWLWHVKEMDAVSVQTCHKGFSSKVFKVCKTSQTTEPCHDLELAEVERKRFQLVMLPGNKAGDSKPDQKKQHVHKAKSCIE